VLVFVVLIKLLFNDSKENKFNIYKLGMKCRIMRLI